MAFINVAVVICAFVTIALIVGCLCATGSKSKEFDPLTLTMEVRDKDLLDWDQLEELRNNGYTVIQVNGVDVTVTTDEYFKIGGTL